MIVKNKSLDNTFKKGTNIDIDEAYKTLLKKGISIEQVSDMAHKLFNDTMKDINIQDIDDDYKNLLHLVVMYFLFDGAMHIFNEWVKSGAEENHVTPEKYLKDVYNI